jgi:hypothetical protein
LITGEYNDELLAKIAELAGCQPEEIIDLDLYLYDVQPAVSLANNLKLKLL